MIFIHGHKDVLVAFNDLVSAKLMSGEAAFSWEVLVLDNDTRWDTWLYLLLRIVYFDGEIVSLQRIEALRFPAELVFIRDELALAFAMTLILERIKSFTKFVKNRTCVTLVFIPGMIDQIISQLTPGYL